MLFTEIDNELKRFDSIVEANAATNRPALKQAVNANLDALRAISKEAVYTLMRYRRQVLALECMQAVLADEEEAEQQVATILAQHNQPAPPSHPNCRCVVVDAGSGHFESRIEQAIAEANQPATPDERMGFDSETEFKQAISMVLTRISEVANQKPQASQPATPGNLSSGAFQIVGAMYHRPYAEYHPTLRDAALSAYWAVEDNNFYPGQILDGEGKVIWDNEKDPFRKLEILAGIEEGPDDAE